jgi:putative aldouronate transport system substrate-binding protein
MDITDRIKASETLQNNIDPLSWDEITVDGKIYASFNTYGGTRVVALNKNLLASVGIDYKTIEPSLDGYYNVFKKLKDEGGFGDDFYPFNTILSETWDLQPWFSSAGLKNGVVLDTDGKKYSPYATADAIPVWEWFKKLYDEGLMDPAAFVDKTTNMREKLSVASQKTAVIADWAAWVGLQNANAEAGGIPAEDFEIVSLPGIDGPNGYMLGRGAANIFAVPANAENVDGAMVILEYFATQEGGELLSIGIEGHDYNIEDGKVVLTEVGTAHAKDHGAPGPVYINFVHPLGVSRGIEEAATYNQYAKPELAIPNEGDWKLITGKWAIQMVRGDVSMEDGLAGMNDELIAAGVVEK